MCVFSGPGRAFSGGLSRLIQQQTSHALPKIHKSQIRQGKDRSAQRVQISPCSIWRVIWKNSNRNAATPRRARPTAPSRTPAARRIPEPPCRLPPRALLPPPPSRPAAAPRARHRTPAPKPPLLPRSRPRPRVRAAMRSLPTTGSPAPRVRAASSACPSIWK